MCKAEVIDVREEHYLAKKQMGWSKLYPELLCLIANKVGEVSNFIRFRAVCKNWRSATGPSDLPHQLPYLIKCKRTSGSLFDIQFGPLFSDKLYTLPIEIPHLQGEPLLYGSLNGYVLLRFFESSTWLLINPFTGFQVPLPFRLDNCYRAIYFGPSCNSKSADKEIDVLFAFEQKNSSRSTRDLTVCLWRYADRSWTKVTEIFCSEEEYIRFANGKLYAISIENGDTKVIDVNTGDVVSFIRGSSMDIHYLTEGYGDVLTVQRRRKRNILNQLSRELLVDVYQLENGVTDPQWLKINRNIGDRILFFDVDGNSLCLKANNFEGFKGGTVYIMDLALYNQGIDCLLLMYDIESRIQVPMIPHILESKWFVPSLLSPP